MLRLAFVLTLLPTLALAGPARVIDDDAIDVAGGRVSDRRRLGRAILDPVSP
jgi:hypothetical protein